MKSLANILLFFVCCYAIPVSASDDAIDPNTVQRWGPAYRYPKAGWINAHIEGEPYEMGVQHGRLLAPEIAAYTRALAEFTNPDAPAEAWSLTRELIKTLFLRGFSAEQLEEMHGIADGASAAGARFSDRPLDLIDIAGLNLTNELHTFDNALKATPARQVDLKKLQAQSPTARATTTNYHGPIRCNAFAAVGPATRDGKIVFGHLTMFALYPANFYNIWLDVKPAKGHRFVMQTTPGGIFSGMDYSINDAGILLSETTVAQTGFEPQGLPLAARIRNVQQYAESIEQAAAMLSTRSNGLSTTEWILADVQKNEIALLTLGTHRSKLYRSSKKEWIAGAEGFYWSNNNAKDQAIRLETVAAMTDRPSAIAAFTPGKRDGIWLQMYDQYKGRIDAAFAKKMLTMPEIVMSVSTDAKYTTTSLATQLQSWGTFGPPLGAARYPSADELQKYPPIKPLVSNPWVILNTQSPAKGNGAEALAADLHNPADPIMAVVPPKRNTSETQPAWHGTLLPKTDAEIWLTTAFANYERIVALEKTLHSQAPEQPLSQHDLDTLNVKLFLYRSRYETAVRSSHDFPLAQTKINFRDEKWYDVVSGKGVLLLHSLRSELGEKRFDALMDKFGMANAGKEITTAQFKTYLEQETGKDLTVFFHTWLDKTGIPQSSMVDQSGMTVNRSGSPFTIFTFDSEVEDTLIVYGTQDDAVANKEAARLQQQALQRRKHNITAPVKADYEVDEAELQHHHLVLIGRPDSNLLVARFKNEVSVAFGLHSFQSHGKTYAHPESAVVVAGDNPLNRRYSIVVVAGLSALGTLEATQRFAEGQLTNAPIVVMPYNQNDISFILPPQESFIKRTVSLSASFHSPGDTHAPPAAVRAAAEILHLSDRSNSVP